MAVESGHNSGDNGQLLAFVERIEKMHEDRDAINADLAEIYLEVKSSGYDKKSVAHVVKLRAEDPDKRRNFEAIVECYKAALGVE